MAVRCPRVQNMLAVLTAAKHDRLKIALVQLLDKKCRVVPQTFICNINVLGIYCTGMLSIIWAGIA